MMSLSVANATELIILDYRRGISPILVYFRIYPDRKRAGHKLFANAAGPAVIGSGEQHHELRKVGS